MVKNIYPGIDNVIEKVTDNINISNFGKSYNVDVTEKWMA